MRSGVSRAGMLALAAAVSAACGRVGYDLGSASNDGGFVGGDGGVLPSGSTFSRALTFDGSTLQGPADDVPFLIALSGPWVRNAANTDGRFLGDPPLIAFSSDDADVCNGASTPCDLDYALIEYNPGSATEDGRLKVWVTLHRLPPRSADIQIHYGALDAGAEDPFAVWSTFEAVWHFDEVDLLDGAKDATPNGNNASAETVPESPDPTGGKIGGAMLFANDDGGGDVLRVQPSQSLHDRPGASGDLTIEAWVSLTIDQASQASWARIFDNWDGPAGGYGLFFSNGRTSIGLNVSDGVAQDSLFTTVNFPIGEWHHVVGVRDSAAGQFRLYVDGALADSAVVALSGLEGTASGTMGIGGRDGIDYTLEGALDEVRISSRARTDAWVAATFATQHSPALGDPDALLVGIGPEVVNPP